MTVVVPRARLEPPAHLVEAIAVIDRGEDRLVVPAEGLVLQLEVLGQRHEDGLHPGPGQLVDRTRPRPPRP